MTADLRIHSNANICPVWALILVYLERILETRTIVRLVNSPQQVDLEGPAIERQGGLAFL